MTIKSDPIGDEISVLRAALDSSETETRGLLEHLVHDIRTARRGAGISAEVLLRGVSPQLSDELAPTLHHFQDSLATMDAILSGISNYCLTLRGPNTPRAVVPTDMVVRLAVGALQKEVRETGAVIVYEDLPEVNGDRDRLICLFRHLIENALRYRSSATPQIQLAAYRVQDQWLFSVQDNGVGIDPKHWDQIFLPFTRLHGRDVAGVGLGLAISKKIVSAHGGRIWIESAVGQGTTVFFTISAGEHAE